jgi:hypothetical protein
LRILTHARFVIFLFFYISEFCKNIWSFQKIAKLYV